MPRALTMRQSRVPASERGTFAARARAAGEHYTAAGCNYWLFESADERGAYVEFVEARDPETLARAHDAAGPDGAASTPVYVQVELN
jgi:hypothetical protein